MRVKNSEVRVEGSGFGGFGLGFRVPFLGVFFSLSLSPFLGVPGGGFRVHGLGFMVLGLGFRVQGVELRVWGLG